MFLGRGKHFSFCALKPGGTSLKNWQFNLSPLVEIGLVEIGLTDLRNIGCVPWHTRHTQGRRACNGTTFHHHFYVKTIENWPPSFFRHNTLSTTGVSNIALVQRTLMAICLHVPKPIITMTHDWSQNNVCDNRLAQWILSVLIILTPISNSMR